MEPIQKILIAEDEADYVRSYIDFFKNKPFKVFHAANGRLCLELVKKHEPNLIIMDWNMPEMSGLEATRRLQEEGYTLEIPIIIATGVMITSENLSMALKAGAYDFVRKPLDMVELEARISSALKLSDSFRQIKELQRQEKAFLEEKIHQQQRELTVAMSVKDNIARGLHEIESDLELLKGANREKTTFYVKDIKKKIKDFSNTDRTWDDFRLHFENVNPRFFERLESSFPKLTVYEQRLLAYLKMGMGNKEIAQVCHINADSVKKSIFRLRKKIQLGTDMSLRDFVAEY